MGKTRRVPTLALLAALAAATPARAQDGGAGRNRTLAFPVLSVETDARAAARPGGRVALFGDLSALYANPAGLFGVASPRFALSHVEFLVDSRIATFAYAHPFPGKGVLGGALRMVHYGSFTRRDTSGEVSGAFRPFGLGISAGFGFAAGERASLGLSGSWYRESVDGSAEVGLSWDFGAQHEPWEDFRWGAAVRNAGVDTGREELPFELGLGAVWRLRRAKGEAPGIAASLGGDWVPRSASRLKGDLEGSYRDTVFLRIGYERRFPDPGLGALFGFAAGVGLRFRAWEVHYAFRPADGLGSVHRLSLEFQWGLPAPSEPEGRFPLPGGPAPGGEGGAKGVLPEAPWEDPRGRGGPVELTFEVPGEDLPARELFRRGYAAETAGRMEEAAAYYRRAVKKNPDLEQAWLRLGRLELMAALEALERARELNPHNEILNRWLERLRRPSSQGSP